MHWTDQIGTPYNEGIVNPLVGANDAALAPVLLAGDAIISLYRVAPEG